ncbi:MAG: hypothetical protein LC776_06155, partial [Acidobacteria bacterium]|nr:hypothetical protein [Acidobacteriota bacterium]
MDDRSRRRSAFTTEDWMDPSALDVGTTTSPWSWGTSLANELRSARVQFQPGLPSVDERWRSLYRTRGSSLVRRAYAARDIAGPSRALDNVQRCPSSGAAETIRNCREWRACTSDQTARERLARALCAPNGGLAAHTAARLRYLGEFGARRCTKRPAHARSPVTSRSGPAGRRGCS